jgi:hypothetical protein
VPVSVRGGQLVGSIDFGFRNPIAAIWGVLDRDNLLWLSTAMVAHDLLPSVEHLWTHIK